MVSFWPPEGLVAEGKGIPETMPTPEPAMLLQLLLAPSPPWHVALVPLWPQSSSTRVGPGTSWLFTGTSVGVFAAVCFQAYTVVFTLFVHQGIVLYCGSSVRGGHFVTRGQIMLWTGVQYCLHCLRPSRNHRGKTRTMTFFVDNMYWTLKIQMRVLNKIAHIWVELNLEYFSSIWYVFYSKSIHID